MLRGSVTLHYQNVDWNLEVGDIIFINNCESHFFHYGTPNNAVVCFKFKPSVFTDVYQTCFKIELNTLTQTDIPDNIFSILRSDLAKAGLLLDKQSPLLFMSHLYHFIGSMLQFFSYQEVLPVWAPVVEHQKDFDIIKEYIQQRFFLKISIDEMCHDLGISRAKLYRVLKKVGVKSFRALVNIYRVEQAKYLLYSTTLSIQYIVTACGFENDSSFYRIFRELTNVSPCQYREQSQIMDPPMEKDMKGFVRCYNCTPEICAMLEGYVIENRGVLRSNNIMKSDN